MRSGHILWVLVLIGSISPGTAKTPSEIAHARQLFESGVSLERLGQYQKAIDILTVVISGGVLNREDAARAAFDRGVAYDALGDSGHAVADYTAAISLMPKLSAALSNRANVYRRRGRLEEAKRDYMAALRCAGVESQYPYFGLGLIAQSLGDKDTARDYLKKALAVAPSFALAAQALAELETPEPLAVRPQLGSRVPAASRASDPPDLPAQSGSTESAGAPVVFAPHRQPAKSLEVAVLPKGGHPSLRQTINDAGDRAGTVQIQLGAFRDERQAADAWSKIAASTNSLFRNMQPLVLSADIPGRGRFWRLRTLAADTKSAREICAELITKGQACMLVRD